MARFFYIGFHKGGIILKEPTKLIIKPYKDNYIAWVADFLILYLIPCVVDFFLDLFTDIYIDWKWYGIGFIIYFLAVSLIAIVARLCYKGKLIVTAEEVIKIHGKKVQFHIKKEEIVSICIRKVNPFIKLLVFISGFIGDICTDLIFFRFYHAEEFEVRRFCGVIIENSLSEEDDKNLQEFAESVTYNQAKKICEILGIPFTVIKN